MRTEMRGPALPVWRAGRPRARWTALLALPRDRHAAPPPALRLHGRRAAARGAGPAGTSIPPAHARATAQGCSRRGARRACLKLVPGAHAGPPLTAAAAATWPLQSQALWAALPAMLLDEAAPPSFTAAALGVALASALLDGERAGGLLVAPGLLSRCGACGRTGLRRASPGADGPEREHVHDARALCVTCRRACPERVSSGQWMRPGAGWLWLSGSRCAAG
jgi:hypothetical protein